jgi:hypothetical protein
MRAVSALWTQRRGRRGLGEDFQSLCGVAHNRAVSVGVGKPLHPTPKHVAILRTRRDDIIGLHWGLALQKQLHLDCNWIADET